MFSHLWRGPSNRWNSAFLILKGSKYWNYFIFCGKSHSDIISICLSYIYSSSDHLELKMSALNHHCSSPQRAVSAADRWHGSVKGSRVTLSEEGLVLRLKEGRPFDPALCKHVSCLCQLRYVLLEVFRIRATCRSSNRNIWSFKRAACCLSRCPTWRLEEQSLSSCNISASLCPF